MKGELLYEGKAKRVFSVIGNNLQVLLEFKDSLTAFNALKKGEFAGKGSLNCSITTKIFNELSKKSINHHFIKLIEKNQMLCKKTQIIPVEVVVRNVLAGSLAKKLGLEEGERFSKPVIEFYYKSDELSDPFINEDHILSFNWANEEQLKNIRILSLKINEVLSLLFEKAGIVLVDFKIEFGVDSEGELILSDEISPDCMRLWDKNTGEKLDKDRFRRDLGAIDKAYAEVLRRIEGVNL